MVNGTESIPPCFFYDRIVINDYPSVLNNSKVVAIEISEGPVFPVGMRPGINCSSHVKSRNSAK